MPIARKLLLAAISTLMAVAGAVVVEASPASAALPTFACRVPAYETAVWEVALCATSEYYDPTGTYQVVDAWSVIFRHPAACATYRVYLVDAANVQRFSTSLRNCKTEKDSPELWVWNGEFNGGAVRARFKAYNSSGGQILSIDSPLIDTTP